QEFAGLDRKIDAGQRRDAAGAAAIAEPALEARKREQRRRAVRGSALLRARYFAITHLAQRSSIAAPLSAHQPPSCQNWRGRLLGWVGSWGAILGSVYCTESRLRPG